MNSNGSDIKSMRLTHILKVAIISLAAFTAVAIYAVLIAGGFLFWMAVPTTKDIPTLHPVIIGFIAFGAVSFIAFAIWIRRKTRDWDRHWYWRSAGAALLWMGLWILSFDCPLPENDWSVKDISLSAPGSEKSYEVLMRHSKYSTNSLIFNATNVTRLRPQQMTNILPFAEEIETAWTAAEPARQYIRDLDAFDVIADRRPGEIIDYLSTNIISLMSVRAAARAHWIYAKLKAEQGKPVEGVTELVRVHSVLRKALPNASLLVSKMVWVAIARGDTEIAHRIADDPACSREALEILQSGFPPLSWNDVSMRRPFIGEYLGYEQFGTKQISATNLYGMLFPVSIRPNTDHVPLRQVLSASFRVLFPVLYQRNRTLRESKAIYEVFLDCDAMWPPSTDSHAVSDKLEKFRRFSLRNVGGRAAVWISTPSFNAARQFAFRDKVLSDLLWIELNARLGTSVTLNDDRTGKPYPVDEKTGIPYCVGPDGQPGTRDDIILGDTRSY